MRKPTFGELGDSRDNNFDFLRFFMASAVIFSHSHAFLRVGAQEPLAALTRWQTTFGGLAVQCFFLMSGYLVTRSWIYSKSVGDYARKRALRIIPALAVVLLFTVFVIGPLATKNLSAYFQNTNTYRYLALMFAPNMQTFDALPGVFTDNLWPRRVNGSLWTIRYEVVCYVMVGLLGVIGAYRRQFLAVGALLLTFSVYILERYNYVGLGPIHNMPDLVTYFLVGTVIYLYRERIPYSPALFGACLAIIAITCYFGVMPLFLPFAGGYVLFYIAFSKGLKLQKFAKHGDFSYGIYLYAFPIQQLLCAYFPGRFNPYSLTAAAFTLTLGCAIASWHLIEKPCLQFRTKPSRPTQEPLATEPVAEPRLVGQPVMESETVGTSR